MTSFDEILFNFFHGLAGQVFLLDLVFVFLAKYLPWIIGIVCLWSLARKKDWGENKAAWKERYEHFALIVLSVILSWGIVGSIIARSLNITGPSETISVEAIIDHNTQMSFPSDHMAFLFPIALGVLLFNRKLGWWAVLGTVVVGISRIIVGVHWPLDILGGLLVGALSFYTVKLIFKKKKLI